MDIRKLEIFSAVARLGSFSQAALTLHMAQPAVSIAVRKLEEELDCKLLDRQGRSVRLTREGSELLMHADKILLQVSKLKQSMSQREQLLKGEVIINCPSMLATYAFPDLLSEFLGHYPGLSAQVTQSGTRHIRALLQDQKIELGVITLDDQLNNDDLDIIELVDEEMMACLSPSHPMSSQKEITLDEFCQTPSILYESEYYIRKSLDRLCDAHNVNLDIRMQTNFLPLITRMVKQNLGITVGLKMMISEEKDLIGVPLKPTVAVKMALARRRGGTLSKANEALWQWLSQQPDLISRIMADNNHCEPDKHS